MHASPKTTSLLSLVPQGKGKYLAFLLMILGMGMGYGQSIILTISDGSTQTSEAGTMDSFDVVLDVPPSSNVIIDVTSGNPNEGTVSPTTLTFTPENYNDPRTVEVTGVDDPVADGAQIYDITLSVGPGSDPAYVDLPEQTISVVNLDDDTAGFLIVESGGSTRTSESGTTDSFELSLTSQPIADVVINVTSGNTNEGTVSPTTLTFTPANYNTPRTVEVTGVDDAVADGDQTYAITLNVGPGSDPIYPALPDQTVSVENLDDDIAGFTIIESDGSTQTSEPDIADSFDVVLNGEPTSTVTITVTPGNANEGTVSPSTLTFTPGTYNVPQTVTVTAVDDDLVEGTQTYGITLSVGLGSDAAFLGLPDQTVSVENLDDDTAGFLIVESDGSTQTSESGTSDSFEISLISQPTAAVMVTVESGNTLEGAVSPISLNFNPGNYNNPQTVTVTGVNDDLVDGTQTYDISLNVSSTSDVNYINLPERTITVNNEDDDVFVATITTQDDTASEVGLNTGSFLVSLDQINNTGSPITISYSVDEEDDQAATPGDDYVALSGSVDIPDGEETALIIVTPIDDDIIELTETITVTLDNGTGYAVGAPATATINLESDDNDSPGGYTITINQDTIYFNNQENVSFSFSGAPILTSYAYRFVSSGDGSLDVVSGNGLLLSPNQTISNIDLSDLLDGTITLSVTLSNILGPVGVSTFDIAIKNTVAPSGYTVSIDEELISLGNIGAVGFTFTGAEVNATYNYSFSSSAGGTPIEGDGSITETNQQIGGIDLTGLPDGLVSLTVSLTNPNGEGIEVTDTVTLDTTLPVDYTVSIDQDPIDSSNMNAIGFTISGGELGDDFTYTFSSSGGGVAVTGNGIISSVPHTVSGLDLSGLGNGNVTLTVILSNASGEGSPATDSAIKGSCFAGDTAPVLNPAVATVFCDAFNQDLNQYVAGAPPTGSVLRWSSNPDLSVTGDYLTGSNVSAVGTYYGFHYDAGNDCFSPALAVTLSQNFSPSAGTVTNASACSLFFFGNSLIDLDDRISGEDPGTWALSGGPAGHSANIGFGNNVQFNGQPLGNYTFTYTTSGAIAPCSNQNVQLIVTVVDCNVDCDGGNSAPPLDPTEPTIFCDDIDVDLNDYLTSTDAPAGTVLTWGVDTNTSDESTHLGGSRARSSGLFYGFYYDEDNNCSSPYVEVLLVSNDTPEFDLDVTQGGSVCEGESLTLTAAAEVEDASVILFSWYDAPTGGNLLGTGATYTTDPLTQTTSFYVEASANNCATTQRVEVVATVTQTPSPGTATDTAACSVAGLGGPNTVDLDTTLNGADPGTWSLDSFPVGGSVAIGNDNVVDFVGLPDGDYVFRYTTSVSSDTCPNSSVEVTVSVTDCMVDTDGDGLLDSEELELGTSPTDPDTDGDGLTDGEEVLGEDDPSTLAVPQGISNPLDPCDPYLTPDCNPEDIDLAITKTVDREMVMLDENLFFTITVENTTMDRVLDIVVRDLLAQGFEYVSHQASLGLYDAVTGDWAIEALAPEESVTLEITARALEAGNLVNTAALVSSFPQDGIAANNTATVNIRVNRSECEDLGTLCNIFSPNGDGMNDRLTLVGHQLYPQNRLEIFDRYGNGVFQMNGYDSSWDGTGKDGDLPKGTYFYILDLLGDGTQVTKGWIQIVRSN